MIGKRREIGKSLEVKSSCVVEYINCDEGELSWGSDFGYTVRVQ